MLIYVILTSITLAFASSLLCIRDIIKSRVSFERKLLAFFVRYLHDTIVISIHLMLLYMLIILVCFKKLKIKTLLIVNIIIFSLVLQFFVYDMCILTIWQNQLLDAHKCIPYSLPFRNSRYNYKEKYSNADVCVLNREKWIKGNQYIITIILCLNLAGLFVV
jgi:hypothetical protein